MLDRAIAHINQEVEKESKKYVTVVGDFLKKYITMDPAAAEKILNEEKSIKKSIDKMREEASKEKVDGVGIMTEEEGFEIVLKYYEIDPIDEAEMQEEKEKTFDVKLSDFL